MGQATKASCPLLAKRSVQVSILSLMAAFDKQGVTPDNLAIIPLASLDPECDKGLVWSKSQAVLCLKIAILNAA